MAGFLAKKKLGLRGLLDVIPLDSSLVKGSHGRDGVVAEEQPVIIGAGVGSIQSAEQIFNYLKEAAQGAC